MLVCALHYSLYGFHRYKEGPSSWYCHEFFIRGEKALCKKMLRCKIKGTGTKRPGTKRKHQQQAAAAPVTPTCKKRVVGAVNFWQELDSIPLLVDELADDDVDPVRDGDLLFFEGIPFHFLEPIPGQI